MINQTELYKRFITPKNDEVYITRGLSIVCSTYEKLLDIIREHYEEKFLEGFAIWKIKIDAKINEGMLVAYFSTKGEIEEIIDTTL